MEEVIPEEPLTSSVTDILGEQFDVLLAVLARPAVQDQVIAIIIILVIAVITQRLSRRWQDTKHETLGPEVLQKMTRSEKALAIVQPLIAPLVALVCLLITMWFFRSRDLPHGLLGNTLSVLLIWLAFRIVLALLYAKFGDAVRPYQKRVFTPLLILVILFSVLNNSLIFNVMLDFPLLRFSGVSTSMGDFTIAFLTIYAFAVISWLVEQILNHFLPERLDAEPGVIRSIATLVRYGLLALGIVTAFGLMGFDATSLAIVAGGLSVGIGIGLQEIVANFVSGLTLLFEQSLRPGDVIELDGRINQVERINLRATIVRTLDNTELIIPNATFTTSQVNNLTRNERLIRTRLPFGVAYGSDMELVRQVARSVALDHDLTIAYPPPMVMNRGFGDSAINFELTVWMSQPEKRESYKSDLYYELLAAFDEHGVAIPFPQRDVHIKTEV